MNSGKKEMGAIANPNLKYPHYYTTSFHAYDEGNLGWLPALEVDVAARAVHARIWPEGDDRAGHQRRCQPAQCLSRNIEREVSSAARTHH